MADFSVAIRRDGEDPIYGAGRRVFVSPVDFGDKVKIDNGEVIGTVVGLCVYPHGDQVMVSWWNNGDLVEQWIASWRVTRIDPS